MRPELTRALIPIYVTNLVDALGYSLLIPLLPNVAERFGAAPVVVGSLLSTTAFVAMLAAPIWGKLSDSLGRKNMIVTAETFSFASNLILALANSLPLFFMSRIIAGLGTGGGGALDEAFIADVTTDEERNQAYAIYGAVYGAAFVIGPLISSIVARSGIGSPFFVAAGLSLINIYLSQRFIPGGSRRPRKIQSIAGSIAALQTADVRRLIVCHFLFIFAIACFLGNLALYFNRIFPKQSHLDVGFFLSAAAVVGGLTIVVFEGKLSKSIGERRVAFLGLTLEFAAYILTTIVSDAFVFSIALLLWAAGAAMVQPTLTVLLSERASRPEIGAVMGITDAMYSLALMAGPILGALVIAANARLLGIIPAIAVGVAWVLMDRIAGRRAYDGKCAGLGA